MRRLPRRTHHACACRRPPSHAFMRSMHSLAHHGVCAYCTARRLGGGSGRSGGSCEGLHRRCDGGRPLDWRASTAMWRWRRGVATRGGRVWTAAERLSLWLLLPQTVGCGQAWLLRVAPGVGLRAGSRSVRLYGRCMPQTPGIRMSAQHVASPCRAKARSTARMSAPCAWRCACASPAPVCWGLCSGALFAGSQGACMPHLLHLLCSRKNHLYMGVSNTQL